jgi:hypothetical protein
MKKLIILIITLFISNSVLAAEPVNPQKLSVSPAILPISLTPGKTSNFLLTIQNLSESSVPLRLSVESFTASDEEGGYKFSTTQSPLSSWVRIDKSDLIIDGGDKRQVDITVAVPRQVDVGGYYAVIFITPYSPVKSDLPKVTPRIGIPIFASLGIDESTNNGSIETFMTNPMFSESGPVNFVLRTKNAGLSHFTGKPIIIIKPLYGTLNTPSQELAEKVILPGKIRRWEGTILNNLPPNIYSLEAQVSIGAGKWITSKTIAIIFPWQKTLITIIIFMSILFILMHLKNISKAIKELLKK